MRARNAANFAVLLTGLPGKARYSSVSLFNNHLNKNTNPTIPRLA